jgi:hypothetical protein
MHAFHIEPVEPGDMDPNKQPRPLKGLDPDPARPAPATEVPRKDKDPADL